MVVLSCKNIHKSYGVETVLENITFNINDGEKVGLIGPNGAGKSTLFKILTGKMQQDDGELFIDKSKTLGYLAQHLSLNSSNTIYEEMLVVFQDLINIEKKLSKLEKLMDEPYDKNNQEYHNKLINDYTTYSELYTNRGGYIYKSEINRVLKGLGFIENAFNKKIELLSGGQKTRVALCKLLLTKPDILLLDEPTNHLDLDAIEWLEDYIKNYKGTTILISHDRYFLDSVTSITMELINGHINFYNGNYTNFIDLKEKNYNVQLKAYNLQQAEIKRQEEVIERYKSFNREKSIKAAESRQKMLDKIVRLDAPDKPPELRNVVFETQINSGNDVLHIENLNKSFNEKKLFENIAFNINRGEKTALIGENGRGKTTLFKIIMNETPKDDGICELGKNVIIGYYDQEQSNLNNDKTVIDEVWDDFPKLTTTQIRNALAAFLFTGDDVFKTISSLSGGEKCRINLLKLILSKSNFLLLDEPTNHLDIMSREALEKALLEYNGTILVISHDRYFLNKVVNKIYELNESEIKEYLGNYNYYVEKKKNPLRFEEIQETTGKTKTQIKQERKKKNELEKSKKKERLKVKNIEDQISDLENAIIELENKLCVEEIYSNPKESEKINKQLLESKDKLDELYNKWETYL
ncbi:ATP-binding cassette domain-containing protein [Clostridium tyrobutyricum]|jgi:ATP-binding cassette subfamily F protein 3|uniref:COG0488: ATPase components of ABC transporters with duplicated ATPase domains n=1 Tax=Clostridium tyrobutyricum DIVETGP TaxID=1408889 RepID=W6N6G8_CLOTY|nr:ABC-F family ATP-binding cassette domain-containing protein [Clostridium tyrobutyricum]AND85883.1 ABC transporter ATPase [Clostridium tyrobutyricum]ANP70396.1 thiamine ABC transporter substrate-binding protein [Clostridium tyrobutyricum]MBV4434624.1 ABC-F family ATP-binding cassette domain-containing protein [Clostridium tyrobutyricum]QNB67970.1 ATP-binding cassette domain-containing protein [Clostridium tyrobutyricum]CDL91775.1 COG0488: ATPase components of ABC transporters with duplicated